MRATTPPLRRRALTGAVTAAVLALLASACTAADDGVDPSSADWPTAVDPAAADGEVHVVWTAAQEAGGEDVLQEEVDRLAEVGYETEPWDPACVEGAAEQIGGVTGLADPLAVGVAFASAEDAGVFDTRYEGTTVTLTSGAYTCG